MTNLKKFPLKTLRLLPCLGALLLWNCAEVPEYGTLNINVSPSSGGLVTGASKQEYENGTVVALTAVAAKGYAFSRWTGTGWISSLGNMPDSSSSIYIDIQGDKTVTANFVRVYTLTIEVNLPDAGNVAVRTLVTPGGVSVVTSALVQSRTQYNEGHQVTVVARPTSGYLFNNWSGASTSRDTSITITMSSDRSLIANFVAAPSTPTGVSATANSPSSITVKWSESSNATGYYIYRSTNSTDPFTQVLASVSSASTTSYTDTGLSPNTTYYYRVAAYNSYGTGAQSTNAYAITPRISLTTEVNPASAGTVTRSPNQTQFEVGDTVRVTARPATGYLFTGWSGASTSSDTSIRITMNDDRSLTANFAPAPGVPTGLSATANPSGSITVSWSQASDANGYRIYRSTSSSGPFTAVAGSVSQASVTSYTDTELKLDTMYYYKVAAYNSYGTGPQSATVNARATLPAPTDVSATAVSSSSIRINWAPSSDVTGYRIYRNASASGTFTEVGNVASSFAISYTDTQLSANTTYYYRVAAYNNNGTGTQSTSVSARTLTTAGY